MSKMNNSYPQIQNGLHQCRAFPNCFTYTSGVEFQARGFFGGKSWENSGLCNKCWKEECSLNGIPSNTYRDKETGELWEVRPSLDQKASTKSGDDNGTRNPQNSTTDNRKSFLGYPFF